MRHRPRPIRVAVLAAATLAAFVLWGLHVGPHLLLTGTVPLLAGATVFEAIPGERRI